MANNRKAKSAREKAALLRQQAERAQARRRTMVVASATVAVIVLAIGLYALVRTLQNQQKDKENAAAKPPANVFTTSNGVAGVRYGTAATAATADKKGKKPTVLVYEDFLCPNCKLAEEADGKLMRDYADKGKITLVYKPVAILDQNSSTGYSTRASVAAAAVLDAAPDKFMAFHDALFANQPAEGGPGLPDSQLVDLAVKAGAPRDKIQAAVTAQTFSGWVAKGTTDFLKKYNGTPTVLVDGKKVDDISPDKLKAAIEKAIGG